MNAINFIPVLLATAALVFASFAKNRNWAMIAFIVWVVLFVLTFYIVR